MASEGQLLATVDKQDRIIKSLKQKSAEAAEVLAGSVATIAAGPLVAWLDVNRPNKEWFGFTESTLIGGLSMVGGLMKMAGQYSNLLQDFGSGILTVEAYKAMRARMQPAQGSHGETGATRPLTARDLEALWSQLRKAA